MRAAVLCPGPSLAAFADRGGYDLRIGVNRAVGLYRCDYWAMLDQRTWELVNPVGRPVIICDRGHYVHLRARYPTARHHHNLAVETIAETLPHKPVKWHTWSMTAAIAAAHFLGARTIEVWGADWSGADDFDDYHDEFQNRTDERWARERKLFCEIQLWLGTAGTNVRRNQPAIAAVAAAAEVV